MNTQGDSMKGQNIRRERGGRSRQGRALATGVAVAVLGAALVGGSTLVGGGAEPGGTAEVTLTPAAGGVDAAHTEPARSDAEYTDAGNTSVLAEPAAAQPATLGSDQVDTTERPGATVAMAPPWQDSTPPLPEGGMSPENPDWPNAWEIPDARPTGVDYLDGLGAPKLAMNYPRMVPVAGVMVCNTGADDVEPLAGQDWMYYLDDGTDSDTGSVDIVVTGWEDSTAARDALRDDTMTFCVRDTASGWQQLEWAEREGDDDYLLYEAGSQTQLDYAFAIVRQGDYLVGVTVTDTSGEAQASAAAEIASKTADNLEALDPVHGRD